MHSITHYTRVVIRHSTIRVNGPLPVAYSGELGIPHLHQQSLPEGEGPGPVERLAVAYAPVAVRPLWLGLLALDQRLSRAARAGEQPVIAQIRLAWWRDRFGESAAQWPAGEPLLALLHGWEAERSALAQLVDGWEALEIGEDGGIALRAARVEALLALARLAGARDDPAAVRRAALEWQDGERQGPPPRLSRAMRPLAVLRGLALGNDAPALVRLAKAVRIGLLGR